MSNQQICPNCGKPGVHFVPSSEVGPGYYVCKPNPPKEKP